jgi:hypothetical protein
VAFHFTGKSRKESQISKELTTGCPQYNYVGYDRGQCSSLPQASSTFLGAEVKQQPIHPTASSTQIELMPPTWSSESVDRTVEIWGLSYSERRNLIDLGHRLQDLRDNSKNNPADVVRFLLANSGDLTCAERKFRDMILWRKQNNVDYILLSYHPPKQLVDHYPGAVLRGMDNAGDPIFLSRLGVTDAAGMLQRFGRREMINHAIWLWELLCTGLWMQEYQNVHNKPVKQALVLEDVHEIQLLQIVCNRPLLSLYAEIMRLDQDNYPEAAKKS